MKSRANFRLLDAKPCTQKASRRNPPPDWNSRQGTARVAKGQSRARAAEAARGEDRRAAGGAVAHEAGLRQVGDGEHLAGGDGPGCHDASLAEGVLVCSAALGGGVYAIRGATVRQAAQNLVQRRSATDTLMAIHHLHRTQVLQLRQLGPAEGTRVVQRGRSREDQVPDRRGLGRQAVEVLAHVATAFGGQIPKCLEQRQQRAHPGGVPAHPRARVRRRGAPFSA
mmetsp:Transcript_75960/g.246523  ORF Transcript_75960/g.246523 Transcript_75960/m.246523 type:complete len:225 (+) Transcript_75960:983-1657(+)